MRSVFFDNTRDDAAGDLPIELMPWLVERVLDLQTEEEWCYGDQDDRRLL